MTLESCFEYVFTDAYNPSGSNIVMKTTIQPVAEDFSSLYLYREKRTRNYIIKSRKNAERDNGIENSHNLSITRL